MMLPARVYESPELACNESGPNERVHILQFLHTVNTSIDKHRPIPIAIVKTDKGLLESIRIDRLRVD